VTFNRTTGLSSDPTHVVARLAPGHLSWEGIAPYPSGVMYYGDENRPGTGTAGGAYFIPTTPVERSAGSLQFSLTAGSVYGCTRIGTLNDLTAEWTGGVFDKFGAHFYASVQQNISGHGVVLALRAGDSMTSAAPFAPNQSSADSGA
jgi:hypothetical protein